jgi:hypothetical protein
MGTATIDAAGSRLVVDVPTDLAIRRHSETSRHSLAPGEPVARSLEQGACRDGAGAWVALLFMGRRAE